MAHPTTDTAARRLKDLASEARKRQGWAASDPTQGEPLTDVLNELTAQRLLAHQYADAPADAQNALTQANKLVAHHGAAGPFTPVDDGVRFFTATTHMAALQHGLGRPAVGGQMAQALRGWTGLLPHVDLTPYVGARTATWLLSAQARGAFATGDLGTANAYADAAVARAREGIEAPGEDAPALVDALMLAADVRWVAGIPGDALALSREAADAAARVAAPVIESRHQVAEGWAHRVMAPLVAARRVLADRLFAAGHPDAALDERRSLIALLESHAARLGAPARDALTRALADLAHDLLTLDRDAEALEVAGRAADAAGELAASEPRAGAHLGAQFIAVTELARALVRRGEAAEASEALASLFGRHQSLRRPEGLDAEVAYATLARAEAERALGDQESAERSLREFHAAAQTLRASSGVAPQVFADVPDPELVRDRLRGVVSRSPLPTPSWSNLSDADSLAAATRAPLAIPEPEAPVELIEDQPSAPAAPRHVEPVAPPVPAAAEPAPVPARPAAVRAPEEEPTPALRNEPTREPVVPEAVPAAPEAGENEPAAAELPEPEPVSEPAPYTPVPERIPEPAEPSPEQVPEPTASAPDPSLEVQAARSAYEAAQASGHRRETTAAASALVDVLRPLADRDARTWGPQLVTALENLGDAKFRAGDWWGSRAPKKEAKTLAKQLGA